MKLFFETSGQASCFLCMVPLGLAMAIFLDISLIAGKMRPVMDVLVLLSAGLTVLVAIIFCRETTLRLYHLLGLTTGALLYTQGIGKIIRWFRIRQELGKRMKK